MISNLRTPDGYRIWGSGEFAHICFESPGCRYRKQGYCVMCDYGAGRMLSQQQALSLLHKALGELEKPVRRLLLGTCGSIFDESEMTEQTLLAICDEISHMDVKSVIFETHYATLHTEKLKKIKRILSKKEIAVELGFESADPVILKKHLNKYMNLDALKEAILLLRGNGIRVILNVFLGAPGLSPKAQLEDALRSVHWAYKHGADEVVVFPANVKPGTELWCQWKSGTYEIPSAWLLAELLCRLTDDELERTSISWYGDRQHSGIDTDVLPPMVCPECGEPLLRFYSDYMRDCNLAARRRRMQQLIRETNCRCHEKLLMQLQ